MSKDLASVFRNHIGLDQIFPNHLEGLEYVPISRTKKDLVRH
jgi:hypothetical protein